MHSNYDAATEALIQHLPLADVLAFMAARADVVHLCASDEDVYSDGTAPTFRAPARMAEAA